MMDSKDSLKVNKIQRYSIKDGPGIRTTIFFKGCPLHCLWCANPETISLESEIFINKEKCRSCGQCIEICPVNCITIDKNIHEIDIRKCTFCKKCINVCLEQVYEPVGKNMTLEEIYIEVLKDKLFFETSNGGITFSGGEATLYSDKLIKLSKIVKKHNIHLALDTSGYVSWNKLEPLLDYIDLVLYDIKVVDDDKHKAYTGVSNKLILKNAKKISNYKNIPMIIRLIIIPDYNDTYEDILNAINVIKQLNSVKQIDILGYHKLGMGKYARLNKEYKLINVKPPSNQHLIKIKEIFLKKGLKNITIGGT